MIDINSAINNKSILRYVLLALLTAFIVFIDQFTKQLVERNMELNDQVTVIKGFFELCYVRNKGASFGMLANARWVFLAVTVVVIIALIILLTIDYFKSRFADISLVFILAGGIGNMIDRIFLGEVIDFFQFQIKLLDFIFNVADVFVFFGTIMFVCYYFFSHGRKIEQISDGNQIGEN